MFERMLEVIEDIEQRKNHLAFALMGGNGSLAFDALAVVVEVSETAQEAIMLAAQFFPEALVLGLQLIDLVIFHNSDSKSSIPQCLFVTFSAEIRHRSHHRLSPCSIHRDRLQQPGWQQSKRARKIIVADRLRGAAAGQCRTS